jgi:hypothetical protein
MRPATRFARAPGADVAYCIFGSGLPDLVFATNWRSNLEIFWDSPTIVRFMERLVRSAG